MTLEILVMLLLLAVTFVAFFREIFPIEVTALGLLAVLVAVGLVPAGEAFAGFGNKVVITIGALFVLATAVTTTGVLEIVADYLSRRVQHRKWLAVAAILVAAGLASGFLNNTAVVAMFIPLIMILCSRLEISPSKVLIPLSFASILGGTLTLIGTSTNLLVSSIIEEVGEPAIGMFEFTKLGIVFLVVGLIYLFLLAPRLLPDRGAAAALTGKYGLGAYLTEVQVVSGSKLAGKTLKQAAINERYGIQVLELLRGKRRDIERIETMPLEEGDELIVQGKADDLLRLRREQGIALLPDVKLEDKELASEGSMVVEGIVTPTSRMIGKTLGEIDFRNQFGGFVLAIRRVGATLRTKVGRVPLQAADSLLMLVPEGRLSELRRTGALVVTSELDLSLRRGRFWWLVFVLLPLVVALAALDVVEIALGAPCAAIVLLLVGAVTPQRVYRTMNWSVLILIAAFVPVGQAMVSTGTAEFLSSGLLAVGGLFPAVVMAYAVLSMLYLSTSLLTEAISNNAAAIILTPIALSLGAALEVDPRPFLMAVCFAASASFMTPIGYQTNLMIYGPGGYRFSDYARVGTPLNVLFWLLATALIPWFWPF